MNTLGRYLRGKGILSAAQLEEATQGQVVYGGRLGTHLVELGFLTLAELEQHLSDYTGVPLPPAEWLARPQPEALRRVSLEVVKRYGVLPLRSERDALHVAMLDPQHPRHLDELRASTGVRIVPYVVSETHLVSLLQEHLELGVGRSALSRRTARRDAGDEAAKAGKVIAGPAAASDEQEEAARQRAALGIHELEGDQELIDERTFASLYEEWTPEGAAKKAEAAAAGSEPAPRSRAPEASEAASTQARRRQTEIVLDSILPERRRRPRRAADGGIVPMPLAITRLEAELEATEDRETVNDLVLRLAGIYASAVALFVVRGDIVMGECAVGPGLPENIRALLLPTSVESALTEPLRTGEPYRGAPRAAIDGRLLAALGRSEASEFCVFPVAIRSRVVSLLCVDNGRLPVGATAHAALVAVCERMSCAYERLILVRRKTHC